MTGRVEQIRRLLEQEPNDPFLLYALAHEHAQAGELEESVRLFDQTLSADPTYCYAYYHKARSLMEMGRRDEANESARAGLKRAHAIGDHQAAGELQALLEEFEGDEFR